MAIKNLKKKSKATASAVQYLLKNPDATAYAVAKATGVTQYIARKLIAERQTPVENLIPGPKMKAIMDDIAKGPPIGVKLLLDAAATFDERGETYGPAAKHWQEVAALWSSVAGTTITAETAVRMMLALKIMRLKETPNHHDSIVDIAGYAAVLADVVAAGERGH